jgi:hypothetical protein
MRQVGGDLPYAVRGIGDPLVGLPQHLVARVAPDPRSVCVRDCARPAISATAQFRRYSAWR